MKRCSTHTAAVTRAITRSMAIVRLVTSPVLLAVGSLRLQLENPSFANESFAHDSTQARAIRIALTGKNYQWYSNTEFIRGIVPKFAGGFSA